MEKLFKGSKNFELTSVKADEKDDLVPISAIYLLPLIASMFTS